MGIAEKFQTLVSNLAISNQSTISDRYKAITKRLNTDFWGSTSDTSHSRYVGSMGRATAINGVSDVDFLMELPQSVYNQYNAYTSNGQSALLQAVKNSILKTYSSTDVGGDGQVVVVNFTNMKFEVLPAFLQSDGEYKHPDSNNGGSWKKTDPIAEITAMNTENINSNSNLKRLAKMARAWKDKNSVPISGFLIDTLAYNFMKNWQYKDKSFLYYDYMTRDFLEYLKNQSSTQNYWLAPGSKKQAARTGNFEAKAKTSYQDALDAIAYENDSKEYSANVCWKKIYGSYFPG